MPTINFTRCLAIYYSIIGVYNNGAWTPLPPPKKALSKFNF